MNVAEVAGLFGTTKEKALVMIEEGLELPKSKVKVKLAFTPVGSERDISDQQLDEFLAKFEAEEPGRNPPVAVRRMLLVESAYRCANCRDAAPLAFHHMVDWSVIPHYDPKMMLPLCGTCHDMCTKGFIDFAGQAAIKAKLLNPHPAGAAPAPNVVDQKRAEDTATLVTLFSSTFHTRIFATFLEYTRDDMVARVMFYFSPAFQNSINAVDFFLHDKLLLGLLLDLSNAVEAMLGLNDWFRDVASRDFEKFDDTLWHISGYKAAYHKFHRSRIEADAAFRLLIEYLREHYKTLNLKTTDTAAYAEYVERNK